MRPGRYNTGMGHFRVPVRLTGPTGRSESVELLVDTGATLVVLPRSLADRLGVEARRLQRVVLAGGAEADWPVGEVRVALEGREIPTSCFIAPEGPPLLGAVALESLFLAVDPVARRLVPTTGLV
jgi:clan AA aspartic protease